MNGMTCTIRMNALTFFMLVILFTVPLHCLGSQLHFSAMGGMFVVFIGILAGIEVTVAYALFSGKNLGRITVMVLSIVDFIVHCATLVVSNLFAIPHIILDVTVFFYMWKPSVVSYFNQEKSNLV